MEYADKVMRPCLFALIVFTSGLLFLGCGRSGSAPNISTTPPILTPELSQDEHLVLRGRIIWRKCRSCHDVTEGGPHKVGPNLYSIIGVTAGTKVGFAYSDAMKKSGLIWDAQTLDGFIETPSTYLEGTKMAFIGIKKPSDRQALIKYLEEITQ